METLSASDAKREFGEVLLKAQRAPVGINKNGKAGCSHVVRERLGRG